MYHIEGDSSLNQKFASNAYHISLFFFPLKIHHQSSLYYPLQNDSF